MVKYVVFDDGKSFDAEELSPSVAAVRRAIGDRRRFDVVQFVGDGSETLYSLPNQNVFSVFIRIGTELVSDETYTVNSEAGKIVFSEAPEEDITFTVTFAYAGYTDDEIAQMINTYGVDGAIIETLNGLLADSARFYDYSQGQTTDKRSQIFDHLKDLLATAKEDLLPQVAIGNRNTGRKKKGYALDLTRDDSFSSPEDGYSSNNA